MWKDIFYWFKLQHTTIEKKIHVLIMSCDPEDFGSGTIEEYTDRFIYIFLYCLRCAADKSFIPIRTGEVFRQNPLHLSEQESRHIGPIRSPLEVSRPTPLLFHTVVSTFLDWKHGLFAFCSVCYHVSKATALLLTQSVPNPVS